MGSISVKYINTNLIFKDKNSKMISIFNLIRKRDTDFRWSKH